MGQWKECGSISAHCSQRVDISDKTMNPKTECEWVVTVLHDLLFAISVCMCVLKRGCNMLDLDMRALMSALGKKNPSPVLHICPLIVGINSSVIINHCFSNIWKSCWSPPRSLRKTSGLITMKWWRCSAALTSSVSVTSARQVTIKALMQTKQPQKRLRDRGSLRWVSKTSRESRPERKMGKFYNRMCRLSISLLIKQ